MAHPAWSASGDFFETCTCSAATSLLPNGLGLDFPGMDGQRVQAGVGPNELTGSEDRDWIAGTPWHKSTPARVEPL